MIQMANGSYIEDKTFCDGSNFVILTRAFCEVPMQIITGAYALS
jgi:hypothetical protein